MKLGFREGKNEKELERESGGARKRKAKEKK
jgi:hypothetical protein